MKKMNKEEARSYIKSQIPGLSDKEIDDILADCCNEAGTDCCSDCIDEKIADIKKKLSPELGEPTIQQEPNQDLGSNDIRP
jgi:hypothetical protein